MSSSLLELDSNGHQLGCPHFGEVPAADPDGGYVDLFCDCHTWAEPKILANGTDIAWPAGWDYIHARAWRAKKKRAAEYSAKAKEAKAIAGKFSPRDIESREKWLRIAEAYQGLAKANPEL